jgi:hypothetical protein
MKTATSCNPHRHFWRFFPIVAVLALFSAGASLRASETLLYSFENDADGFAANSGGTYSQDTIGATDGQHSLKVFSAGGPGFFGGLTTVLPLALGDPPGIDYISFDMTLPSVYGAGNDTPGFAVVGVSIFGHAQPGDGPGYQAQFDDIEHIDGKAAGTYSVRIDLNSAAHPLTGDYPQTFDQIFGTVGSGPNDLIPSGFELFFNKNASLSYPMTVYIDNIRAGINPPPVPGDYNSDGVVNAADYALWRKTLGTSFQLPNEVTGTTPGQVTPEDYTAWRARFGNTGGSGLGSSAVPEPGVASIVLAAAGAFCQIRRLRRTVR